MANHYRFNINPFSDILLEIIINGGDISSKKNEESIFDIFKYILELYLENVNDVVYLDYSIKNRDGHYTIIGNNIITALWLSGIIPDDTLTIINENEYLTDSYRYTFDEKKKILTYKEIK